MRQSFCRCRIVGYGCLFLVAFNLVILWYCKDSYQNSQPIPSQELKGQGDDVNIRIPSYDRQTAVRKSDVPPPSIQNRVISISKEHATTTPTTHQSLIRSPNTFIPLTLEEANKVEKFVFFIGYPRSGHSIIGTLLDAHPNMIIAHEFKLFESLTKRKAKNSTITRLSLFNALYQNSFEELAHGERNTSNKGYMLAIKGLWQASFTQHLKVIGNKRGGWIAKNFGKEPGVIKYAIQRLVTLVGVPVLVIHVVRNPFDMIATEMLYRAGTGSRKHEASEKMKYNNTFLLEEATRAMFARAKSVVGLQKKLNLSVIEVHHEDLVEDPRSTLLKLCAFLDVYCSEAYLQSCAEKTYSSAVESRNTVVWSEYLLSAIRNKMFHYPFFERYY